MDEIDNLRVEHECDGGAPVYVITFEYGGGSYHWGIELSSSALCGRPMHKEFTVNREGFEDTFVGTLRESQLGYSLYVLPDFTLTSSGLAPDLYDVVASIPESPLMSIISMHIYWVSSDNPIPEPMFTPDLTTRYLRTTVDDMTFEAERPIRLKRPKAARFC